MSRTDPLADSSLRLPRHAIEHAARIAAALTQTTGLEVTRSDVLRRAVILGLDQLAKEHHTP